jgi:hypothetical protein
MDNPTDKESGQALKERDSDAPPRRLGRRISVSEPTPETLGPRDYADAFEVARDPADPRSAERWARDGFEGLPYPARSFVLFVHRHVFGFDLGSWESPDHVFGWEIVESEPLVLHLRADSGLMQGRMVWRLHEDRLVMNTYLRYGRRRTASSIWAVLGNIHRGGSPGLLGLAARGFRRG